MVWRMPPPPKQGCKQVRRAQWDAPGGLCQPHKRPLLLTAVQRTLPAWAGSAALLCRTKAAVAPSKGPPVVFHGEDETPPLAIAEHAKQIRGKKEAGELLSPERQYHLQLKWNSTTRVPNHLTRHKNKC